MTWFCDVSVFRVWCVFSFFVMLWVCVWSIALPQQIAWPKRGGVARGEVGGRWGGVRHGFGTPDPFKEPCEGEGGRGAGGRGGCWGGVGRGAGAGGGWGRGGGSGRDTFSHFFHTFFTLVSHFFHTFFTLVSHFFHTFFTLLPSPPPPPAQALTSPHRGARVRGLTKV